MVMGSLPERVDLAVVGGGVGGYVAAIRGAELGMSVAIVEKEKMGGHCLNYACIPSKTLIHISGILEEIKDSAKFGISVEGARIDPKVMYGWRMGVSEKLEKGVEFLCKAHKIEVIKGNASFTSSTQIQVSNGVSFDFKNAVIATGSEPTRLNGFDFDGKTVIDYKEALMLDYIPRTMAIIGAGYVAVELGMLYAKMGAKVDIVARSDLLSRFDQEAVGLVKKRMDALGIKIHKGVLPTALEGNRIKLSDGSEIESEIIVVAVGLSPFTYGLGLENTKVKLDEKGFVKVGADLRTDDTNILAIGDVIGEPMLAHKAIRQGVVAAEIAAGQATRYENKVVPAVVFSTPEIAIAGSIAQTEGVKVTKFPLSALGRAIALDTEDGFVKMAYDEDGVVKGVEIVSQDANAMIAKASLAIEMGATIEDIADTIHPHPTYSEAVQEAAEAAFGKPVHFFYG